MSAPISEQADLASGPANSPQEVDERNRRMREAAAAVDDIVLGWEANRSGESANGEPTEVGRQISQRIRDGLRLGSGEPMPYEMRSQISRILRDARGAHAETISEIKSRITADIETHYRRSRDALFETPEFTQRQLDDMWALQYKIAHTTELTRTERGHAIGALRRGHYEPHRPLQEIFPDAELPWQAQRGDPLRALAHQFTVKAQEVNTEIEKLAASLRELHTRVKDFSPADFKSQVDQLTAKIADLRTKAADYLSKAQEFTVKATAELTAKAEGLRARVTERATLFRTGEERLRRLEQWQQLFDERATAIERSQNPPLTPAEVQAEDAKLKQFLEDQDKYGPLKDEKQMLDLFRDLGPDIPAEVAEHKSSPSAEAALFNLCYGNAIVGAQAERASDLIRTAVAHAEEGRPFAWDIAELVTDEAAYDSYIMAVTMGHNPENAEEVEEVDESMRALLEDYDAVYMGAANDLPEEPTWYDPETGNQPFNLTHEAVAEAPASGMSAA